MTHRAAFVVFLAVLGCAKSADVTAPGAKTTLPGLPVPPLGITSQFTELAEPPSPARVKLGRFLFFDKRLSVDNTVACATCHRPENAFSEPTAVSTGVRGQKGGRKSPGFVNLAWTLFPNFFWDGRAASLEEQAKGPIQNPIEMGNTHENAVKTISGVKGYAPLFDEAFGSPEVNIDRIAKAIADYERTRMSGNSPFDKWQAGDEKAVSTTVKKGHELFFGKARCNQCHLGQNFTDNLFHNLGVGWDKKSKKFKDSGRVVISGKTEDTGAFKTPGLREVTKHPPFMHDGSMKTLKEVVAHYNKGGHKNPHLSPKIEPLKLSNKEIDAVVAFMEALEGEGYQDKAPEVMPN
jgi:cytochrome c peroxidase